MGPFSPILSFDSLSFAQFFISFSPSYPWVLLSSLTGTGYSPTPERRYSAERFSRAQLFNLPIVRAYASCWSRRMRRAFDIPFPRNQPRPAVPQPEYFLTAVSESMLFRHLIPFAIFHSFNRSTPVKDFENSRPAWKEKRFLTPAFLWSTIAGEFDLQFLQFLPIQLATSESSVHLTPAQFADFSYNFCHEKQRTSASFILPYALNLFWKLIFPESVLTLLKPLNIEQTFYSPLLIKNSSVWSHHLHPVCSRITGVPPDFTLLSVHFSE